MKVSGIKYLVNQGFENIWKNKMMTFATFCVLLISLLLVGIAGLFYININSMILGLSDKNEIAVYLEIDTPEERVKEVENELLLADNVDRVIFISKQQALERMQNQIASKGRAIFNYIDGYDFMPDGFSVTVKNNDIIEDTTAQIAKIADVQSAQSSPKVAEFLRELRQVVSLIAGAIIIALAAVSMIMISNTNKASVYARREEIQIMKYVGAKDGFIKMPFAIEGIITSLIAVIIVLVLFHFSYDSVIEMIGTKASFKYMKLPELMPNLTLMLVVISFLIGTIGSTVSMKKYLEV